MKKPACKKIRIDWTGVYVYVVHGITSSTTKCWYYFVYFLMVVPKKSTMIQRWKERCNMIKPDTFTPCPKVCGHPNVNSYVIVEHLIPTSYALLCIGCCPKGVGWIWCHGSVLPYTKLHFFMCSNHNNPGLDYLTHIYTHTLSVRLIFANTYLPCISL